MSDLWDKVVGLVFPPKEVFYKIAADGEYPQEYLGFCSNESPFEMPPYDNSFNRTLPGYNPPGPEFSSVATWSYTRGDEGLHSKAVYRDDPKASDIEGLFKRAGKKLAKYYSDIMNRKNGFRFVKEYWLDSLGIVTDAILRSEYLKEDTREIEGGFTLVDVSNDRTTDDAYARLQGACGLFHVDRRSEYTENFLKYFDPQWKKTNIDEYQYKADAAPAVVSVREGDYVFKGYQLFSFFDPETGFETLYADQDDCLVKDISYESGRFFLGLTCFSDDQQ